MIATPIRDLTKDLVSHLTTATEFDITVTNGRTRISFTERHPCWHAALMSAFDRYGIPAVVCVKPHREPAEREQLCLLA